MPLSNDEHNADVFTWPPKDPEPTLVERPTPIAIRLPNRMIESIETQLFGRTGLAFDLWAQQTGWTRDQINDYCWRCAGSIGEHETDGEGCATCRSKPLPWDRAIRLSRYAGTPRTEVLALKFNCWRPTGDGLGMHLGKAIREQLDHAQISPDQAILVPIPMHRFRRVTRGVDHTAVLAKAAAKSSGCSLSSLLSTRLRPEQVGLSMTARAKNIKDAFFLSKRARRTLKASSSQDRRVYILIDDVRTTGATFVAASKALKTALRAEIGTNLDSDKCVEIWIACIGVAGESRRGIDDAQG